MRDGSHNLKDLAELCATEDWLMSNERLMIVSPAGGSAAMYDNMTSFVRAASPAAVLALYERIEQLPRTAMTNKDTASVLHELVEAARPFTSGYIVDETSGTLPLMARLGNAIYEADALTQQAAPEAPALPADLIADLRDAIEVAQHCAEQAEYTVREKHWISVRERLNAAVTASTVAAPVAPSREAAPSLMRQAVASVASNVDGEIRVNWMRPERVEAGALLYVLDRAALTNKTGESHE